MLLLDFETWHCVLNRWYLSQSWAESREWCRKTKGFGPNWNPLPSPLEAELQSTWQRVFDFDLLKRAKMWGHLKTHLLRTRWIGCYPAKWGEKYLDCGRAHAGNDTTDSVAESIL